MTNGTGFLRVKSTRIVDHRGDEVRLRGVCLGGWMNMENFITGYPGYESGMRAAVTNVLGRDLAGFFFEQFLDRFITEQDFAYLRDLNCTVVRIPLNYRHFESDDRPFEYKAEGFARLNTVIGWARAHHLYVILDLHAVQGWQNPGWHCDNPCNTPHFWGQPAFEDRAVALWQEFARRYRHEPTIAGYNVMNEPVAGDVSHLNHFYRRVTEAIRSIDPDHILFLEGNFYSQQFDQLDPPFDDNTVYSTHNYPVPALDPGEYPGIFNGEPYDYARLEREYAERARFMQRHGVPNWVGEFGALYTDPRWDASRLRVMSDMIDIFEKFGHHWTLWTYKDIGKMGLVTVHPKSEWMERTRVVRDIKTKLRADYWVERHESEVDRLFQAMVLHVRSVAEGVSIDRNALPSMLTHAVCEGVFQRMLLPAFAEQFRGMGENEIDRMMQSFEFQNCVPRDGFRTLFGAKAKR